MDRLNKYYHPPLQIYYIDICVYMPLKKCYCEKKCSKNSCKIDVVKCTASPKMKIGWIVHYGLYDERVVVDLKIKYPDISVDVVQIPFVDPSASTGPTSLSTVLLLLEQSVVMFKNKNITHIVVPAQSYLLAPFIRGDSPLDGRSIDIRHIGINFYNNNSATPEVFNARTMLRFTDTANAMNDSIYQYISGTGKALFLYEVGSGGAVVKEQLKQLAPSGLPIVEVALNYNSGYDPANILAAIAEYKALPSGPNDISIVVHCTNDLHAAAYIDEFNTTIFSGPNPNVINIAGNFDITTPLSVNVDIYFGTSIYIPTPLQLDMPNVTITEPSNPTVSNAYTYYEIFLYIASNGAYRGAFGTLKFINRTKVEYWIADIVLKAGKFVKNIDNLRVNPLWISA